MSKIEGLIAAPMTPMNEDGSVALDRIGYYANFLARNGVRGAFVNGTTGESMSLTMAERRIIAERWVAEAPDDFRVIIHAGHTCLADCKDLAAHAGMIGASAVAIMAPFFFRPLSVPVLVDFAAEVASAAPDTPFYYYHIPAMSGVQLPMVEFLQTAAQRIPTLAGMKYTFEDLEEFRACSELDGGRFDVLFGRDEIFLDGLKHGAVGGVGSTYNFAAGLYLKIIEAYKSGDEETAATLQSKSWDMIEACRQPSCHTGSVFKAIMKEVGMDCGPVRLPMTDPELDQFAKLMETLNALGFEEFRNG